MLQTTSLELSRKLQIAGFPQETVLYWVEDAEGWELAWINPEESERLAAPTAEEVLALLPLMLPNENRLGVSKNIDGQYKVFYDITGRYGGNIWYDSLAEAAGKCWLYLNENSLLKVIALS